MASFVQIIREVTAGTGTDDTQELLFMKLESEIWKPVEGFEGWYEVSNLGNVRRMARRIVTGATIKQQLLIQ